MGRLEPSLRGADQTVRSTPPKPQLHMLVEIQMLDQARTEVRIHWSVPAWAPLQEAVRSWGLAHRHECGAPRADSTNPAGQAP